MPSKLSYLLIASLVANAGLLGVVGGGMLHKDRPMSALHPPHDVVQAAWAQLPDADRAELRRELKDQWAAMSTERARLLDAGKTVHDVAMAEPFDPDKLRDAVIVFQQRQKTLQQRAEDILISHLGKMPPEARGTAAVGLLTPFSAGLNRGRHGSEGEASPGAQLGPLRSVAKPEGPSPSPHPPG